MENINLIRKIAWSFQKSTHLEYDDLFQEAAFAYLKAMKKYNPKKGAITTYSFYCMTSHLKNYVKKQNQYNLNIAFDEEITPLMSVSNYIKELPIDAKEIVNLILEQPLKYSLMPAKDVKKEIGNKLIDKGWRWSKLWSVMNQLKLTFN